MASDLVLQSHNACLTIEVIAIDNDLTLKWVKSHKRNPGDEAADKLAGRGLRSPFMRLKPVLPISLTAVNTLAPL